MYFLVVLPPVVQTQDFDLSRVKVHTQDVTLLGVALLAGGTTQQFLFFVFNEMLKALKGPFIFVEYLHLALVLLLLDGLAFLLLMLNEIVVYLLADHLDFLEVLHDLEAD